MWQPNKATAFGVGGCYLFATQSLGHYGTKNQNGADIEGAVNLLCTDLHRQTNSRTG
jgi:hypothetical protein